MTQAIELDGLARHDLLRVAHEYMLLGMLVNRAMLPQVVLGGGGLDGLNEVAIDEWMGASPVYTKRMRTLMGIEGHGVEAIMKALQLDVGFVHQYMDVAYKLIDDEHGEFWLQHCGALMDAEPHGEDRVFGMCHTIEDPTFDATALATNPRARIRPIHRPPRQPVDRHPHCHWTIVIDEANEPVGPIALTEQVGALAMASVANAIATSHRSHASAGPVSPVGLADYRGPLQPALRLRDLADPTLAAVAREFQMQSHLLVSSGELTLRERFGREAAAEMTVATATGAGWIASERLAAALGLAADTSGLARLLMLHPMVPPGFDRVVRAEGAQVQLVLTPDVDGLLDPDHAGVPGLLARGEGRGIEAMVHALCPTAAVQVSAEPERVVVDAILDPAQPPVKMPDSAALAMIGIAASWTFDTSDVGE